MSAEQSAPPQVLAWRHLVRTAAAALWPCAWSRARPLALRMESRILRQKIMQNGLNIVRSEVGKLAVCMQDSNFFLTALKMACAQVYLPSLLGERRADKARVPKWSYPLLRN